MTPYRALRSWPEWWAAVANHDFIGITHAEEILLFEAARRIASQTPAIEPPRGMPEDWEAKFKSPTPDRFRVGMNPFAFEEDDPAYLQVVSKTMARAISCFVIFSSVLDGAAAEITAYTDAHTAKFAWLDKNGRVRLHDGTRDPITTSFLDLFRERRRFPIARCRDANCQRYFAWKGPQKFCSLRCQSNVREAERKGTEARRETLRRAAEKYREGKKKGTRKTQTPKRRS